MVPQLEFNVKGGSLNQLVLFHCSFALKEKFTQKYLKKEWKINKELVCTKIYI